MPRGRKRTSEELSSMTNVQNIEGTGFEDNVGLLDAPTDSPKNSDYTLEIVKDYTGAVDTFYLNKTDPNYQYRFLRNEHKNLSEKTGNLLLQKGGWQLCPKQHLLRTGIVKSEKELDGDGLYRRGDTVLAFMPKDLYKEKEADKSRKAREPMDAIRRLLKKGNPGIGGKDIHKSMKGIQTGKSLGMTSDNEEDE
ncbi:MAG TPA: hypothetical protein V6D12_14150 [Candidatus Obscuribacterales bacterium]